MFSCLFPLSAVRLGRCPKKDRPSSANFFVLPQNQSGAVDVDKQVKNEQMVLCIHDAFKSASKEFDRVSKDVAPVEVSRQILFVAGIYVLSMMCKKLIKILGRVIW